MKRFLNLIGPNSYLAPYVGNDPVCASEHGGLINYPESFFSADYLMSASQLQERLAAFSSQIQEAVSLHESD